MNPAKAARFAELARQLERERAAARTIVDQLRGTIHTRLEQEIPIGWQTIGFASEATAAASAVLESDPKAARAFAQFALAILTRIPADACPASLRRATESMSWKELANAHRYLSNYDAAHRALDAGERCLGDSLTSAYDRAALQFARALVYCDERRFEEAERELASAVEIFDEHSDSRETAKCRLLQGMSAHRRGSLREACSLYRKAMEAAGRSGDLATLASASNNLGTRRPIWASTRRPSRRCSKRSPCSVSSE